MEEPRMGTWQLPREVASSICRMSGLLDGRNAWRLCPLFVGALFARGRRTVASWLRAGGLSNDYEAFYYFLSSVGRKAQTVAACLLNVVRERVAPNGRLLLALADTVTKRSPRHLNRTGIHPTPTPAPPPHTSPH